METKYVMDGHIDKRKTYCWPTPANGGIKNTLHDKILEQQLKSGLITEYMTFGGSDLIKGRPLYQEII